MKTILQASQNNGTISEENNRLLEWKHSSSGKSRAIVQKMTQCRTGRWDWWTENRLENVRMYMKQALRGTETGDIPMETVGGCARAPESSHG